MAKIGLPKGSGKRLKVREKSVKSQGILKWILSGKPDYHQGQLYICAFQSYITINSNADLFFVINTLRIQNTIYCE